MDSNHLWNLNDCSSDFWNSFSYFLDFVGSYDLLPLFIDCDFNCYNINFFWDFFHNQNFWFLFSFLNDSDGEIIVSTFIDSNIVDMFNSNFSGDFPCHLRVNSLNFLDDGNNFFVFGD